MAFQGTLEFLVLAVGRGQKSGAHQAENDVGSFQLGLDLTGPFLAGADQAIVPRFNHPFQLQGGQMVSQRHAQAHILVGVGDE